MNWCYTMIKVLFEVPFNSHRAEWEWKCESGSGRSNVKELWVEKYKPHSLEELAVHKKKVELIGLVLQI